MDFLDIGEQFVRRPRDRLALDRGDLSRAHQQLIFAGHQPAVCRQNRTRRPCGLDVGRRHPGTRLGFEAEHRSALSRSASHFTNGPTSPGRWSSLEFSESGPPVEVPLPRHRCCALGHPDLVARMIPGTFVSVLAANLYVAAAVLDRLPGSSLVGIHVPAFRLASSLAF
jgi:hypothetical protein